MDFLHLAELIDSLDQLEQTIENLDEISFDSFAFCGVLVEKSLPFMVYKIFTKYDLLKKYNIELETCYNFSKEISQGYFKENPYHNCTHIVDSVQAMHYLLTVGNL